MKDQPMRMSEEEAKERWCPLSFNTESDSFHCFGSKCMGWRWVGKEEHGKTSEGFCGIAVHFPSR